MNIGLHSYHNKDSTRDIRDAILEDPRTIFPFPLSMLLCMVYIVGNQGMYSFQPTHFANHFGCPWCFTNAFIIWSCSVNPIKRNKLHQSGVVNSVSILAQAHVAQVFILGSRLKSFFPSFGGGHLGWPFAASQCQQR